jgi:hypothetical protein
MPSFENLKTLKPITNPTMWTAAEKATLNAAGRTRAVVDQQVADIFGHAGAFLGKNKKEFGDAAMRSVQGVSSTFARMTRLGALAVSPRSAMLQYMQFFVTAAEVGPVNAFKAMSMMMEGGFGAEQMGMWLGAVGGAMTADDEAGGLEIFGRGALGALGGFHGGKLLGKGMAKINPQKFAQISSILDETRPGWRTEQVSAMETINSRGKVGQALDIAEHYGYWAMNNADALMRNHAAVAGYLEATQKGMTGQVRADFARDAMNSTQFNFESGSTPGIIQGAGKSGSAFTALQSYTTRNLAFWAGRMNAGTKALKAGDTAGAREIFGRSVGMAGAAIGVAAAASSYGLYLADDTGVMPMELASNVMKDPSRAPERMLANPATKALMDFWGKVSNDPKQKDWDMMFEQYIVPSQVRRLMAATSTSALPNSGQVAHMGPSQVFMSSGGFSTGVEATKGRKIMKVMGIRDAEMEHQNQRLRDRNRELQRFQIERSRVMREASRLLGGNDYAAVTAKLQEAWPYYRSPSAMLRALINTRQQQLSDPRVRQLQKEPRAFTATQGALE